MKRETVFLMLPFCVSALNFLLALLIHNGDAQPVLNHVVYNKYNNKDSLDVVVVEASGELSPVKEEPEPQPQEAPTTDNLVFGEERQLEDDTTADDERDPMLELIPGTNFYAYKRADISSFYGLPPGSKQETTPSFKGQAGKFVNMSPHRMSLWWVGPKQEAVFNSHVNAFGAGGTATFPGHEFIFTKYNVPTEIICRFEVVSDVSVYYCDPYEGTTPNPASGTFGNSFVKKSLNELSASDREYYDMHLNNLEFGKLYKNFTGGQEWLSMLDPSDPTLNVPKHKMWRADTFGQTHYVASTETQFHSLPHDYSKKLSIADMKDPNDYFGDLKFQQHRDAGTVNLTIKALSVAPRAFEIRHFLSDFEVNHILEIVNNQTLVRSTTGGHVSKTRTSRTTWLPRSSDPILNVIYRRAADALRMDEAYLRERSFDEVLYPKPPHSHKINEDLQIVHYSTGQQYTAHHDFGYPEGPGAKHISRSINLCMYLNDVPAGGETAFPRWRNAETDQPIAVRPEKGKAMIFYMVNPDGNLDDLTQHAAQPVLDPYEKYFANLWISSF